jgi:hypothetical protein
VVEVQMRESQHVNIAGRNGERGQYVQHGPGLDSAEGQRRGHHSNPGVDQQCPATDLNQQTTATHQQITRWVATVSPSVARGAGEEGLRARGHDTIHDVCDDHVVERDLPHRRRISRSADRGCRYRTHAAMLPPPSARMT